MFNILLLKYADHVLYLAEHEVFTQHVYHESLKYDNLTMNNNEKTLLNLNLNKLYEFDNTGLQYDVTRSTQKTSIR